MASARKLNGEKFKNVDGKDIPEEMFLNDPLDSTMNQMKTEEIDAVIADLGLKSFIPKSG